MGASLAPDGCSVPWWLRLLVGEDTTAETVACNAHDLEYLRGGTRKDRAIADAELLLGWLLAGMDPDRANRHYTAVRLFGKRHWGDGTYTDDPPAAPAATEAA